MKVTEEDLKAFALAILQNSEIKGVRNVNNEGYADISEEKVEEIIKERFGA